MLIPRILTALVFAPALLFVVWRGGAALQVTCFVLALLAMYEFLTLTLGAGERYLKGVGYLLGAAVAAHILKLLPAGGAELTLPLVTLLAFIAVLLKPEPIAQSMARAGLLVLGALYAGGLITYLSLLRDVPGGLGLGLALMAVFCTWGADTGAYFAGRFLGRHKLYPTISPAKTVEGLVGGVTASVAVAFIIASLFDVPLATWHLVAIGCLAGLLGTAGDLSESMLKRSVGAKDSSKLIPGHGGVLDRFDAVMFVAPGVYVFVRLVL